MNWLKQLILYLLFNIGADPRKPEPVKPIPETIPPKPETKPPKPDPIPLKEMVLFDLPQTAIDMFKQGFPGREGVLLYALGQVANGWPIPGQSEELITIASFYDQINVWYEAKVVRAYDDLKSNPGLTLTIIANDQKDRFGCRIGPASFSRLKEFGDRVQMGQIVPESEY